MRIYKFWHAFTEEINGFKVNFKAGSDISPEDAAARAQEKKRRYEQHASGLLESQKKESYEVAICEEIVEYQDEKNVITRNRYGALVLNSTELAFMDIDFDGYLPPPKTDFKSWLLQLLGKLPKPSREERFGEVIRKCISEKYPYSSFRLYRTSKGYRLVTPAKGEAASEKIQEMMKSFFCDELYRTLCLKQNCFRARLTPKPRRMKMKTAMGFAFPFAESEREAREKWLAEYESKRENYRTCKLVAEFGSPIKSAALQKHDEMCKCSFELPLA